MNANSVRNEIELSRKSVLERIHQGATRAGRDPHKITLLAVSKKQSLEKMQAYMDVCMASDQIAVFGENYVQDFVQKRLDLKAPFLSHFIGRLQSNKAKLAVESFDVIESCHSEKILTKINQAAARFGKIQDVYLQVNISEDEAKGGFCANDATSAVHKILPKLKHLRLCGLMTITRYYDDPELARPDFKRMAEVFEETKSRLRSSPLNYSERFELSMGMSADFEIAVEEGATLVRVGTELFGAR